MLCKLEALSYENLWLVLHAEKPGVSLNLGPFNALIFDEDLKKFRVVYSVTR